jgi:hypothetical protein
MPPLPDLGSIGAETGDREKALNAKRPVSTPDFRDNPRKTLQETLRL